MIHCERLANCSPASAYLSRDAASNGGLLAAIKRNVPPVARDVWVARADEGTIVGVAQKEDFPHGTVVSLEADIPEAVEALVRAVGSNDSWEFSIREGLLKALRSAMPDLAVVSQALFLTLSPGDLRKHETRGEVRTLTPNDAPLWNAFDIGRPGLSDFVAWAAADPDTQTVFGLVADGQVVSFAQFALLADKVWEAGLIMTRPELRRRGLAKSVLSAASEQMLGRGVVPVLHIDPDNTGSLRTADAVGYRQGQRKLLCRRRSR